MYRCIFRIYTQARILYIKTYQVEVWWMRMATAPVQTWNLTMVICNLHQAASSCSLRTRRCRAFVLPTSGTMTTNPGWNVCHSLLPSPQIRRGIQYAQQGYKHVQKRKSLAKKMVFHPAWRSSGLT